MRGLEVSPVKNIILASFKKMGGENNFFFGAQMPKDFQNSVNLGEKKLNM